MIPNIRLSHCRFCGGLAKIWEKDEQSYRAYCKSCFATTHWRSTPEGAADVWNMKADSDRFHCPCCGADSRVMVGKSGEFRVVCKNPNCGISTNWCGDRQKALDLWHRRA